MDSTGALIASTEHLDWPASLAELADLPLQGIPTEVLAVDQHLRYASILRLPPKTEEAVIDAWRAWCLALSPGATRVTIADGSGHSIQLDRPDLVLAAIDRLIDGAREGGWTLYAASVTADDVIAALGLEPHREGGWFAETWREPAADGERPASSAIHYLLRAGERSHWHRVDATETWHHYAGGPLVLRVSVDGRTVATHVLGMAVDAGERPQVVVLVRVAGGTPAGRLDAGRVHGRAGVHVRRVRAGAA